VDGGEDARELLPLLPQGGNLIDRQEAARTDQFQPQNAFIGLLQRASDLVDPVCAAAGAARGSVSGGNRRGGPENLVAQDSSFGALGQGIRHAHHP